MRYEVLDHGYVESVECWGADDRIIEAARMSTGRGFEGWEKDAKLLKYLYTHKHMTPFEMCGLVLEIKAPIFVFREWHRHRTQSYNEMSARYIPLPDENYLPDIERCQMTSTTNRQAQGTVEAAAPEVIRDWLFALDAFYDYAQGIYSKGLAIGVPKELARLAVPVARYSKMRASANLRNWLQFLELRMAEGAQWEIRQYANTVGRIIEATFPRVWELFKGDSNVQS